MSRLRLLFAGNFHWNAGSSHVIAEYARVAQRVGCEVGVSTQLARMDGAVRAHLPLIRDVRWATHLLLVFEGRQFLEKDQLDLCEGVPRHRRVVIDPDGHWGPLARRGEDSSNGGYAQESWQALYASLSDLVLQPRVAGEMPPGAEFHSYFGMPPIYRLANEAPVPAEMPYQLQYIGNNWWRWEGLTALVTEARNASPRPERIRVCGRWWDGTTCEGHESATTSVPKWLIVRGVEVAPPVPFGQVVPQMSRSTVTPILARPLLAAMGMLTPRMFETIASGSIPAIDNELQFLAGLYGDAAHWFLLGDDPSDVIGGLLRDHRRYRTQAAKIQAAVHAEFNYAQTLARLVALLN